MFRILLMVFYNLIHVPTWGTQMLLYARKNDKHSEEERYRLLQKITLGANRGGRVKIHAEGMENLPEKMDLSFIQIIRDCLMCWLCWRAVQALHGG